MQKFLIAALLLGSFVAAVFAAETFYAEPSDKIQHKILGTIQGRS